MKKIVALCLSLLLALSIIPSTLAQSQNDWTNLKNFIGQEVAVKTKRSVTSFGLLFYADDSEIRLNLADDERVSTNETSFKRDEVMKIWRATLRFGESNIGKGALIGAGAGFGVGITTALVMAQRGSSDPPVGFGLFPIIGAGVGAIVGAVKPKRHKKRNAIYCE